MPDAVTTIGSLKDAVRAFADERQWQPSHTPKNLSMALACEAAELMEPFRWLTGDESHQACSDPSTREAIADELADVACLVFQFSVASGIVGGALVMAWSEMKEAEFIARMFALMLPHKLAWSPL